MSATPPTTSGIQVGIMAAPSAARPRLLRPKTTPLNAERREDHREHVERDLARLGHVRDQDRTDDEHADRDRQHQPEQSAPRRAASK